MRKGGQTSKLNLWSLFVATLWTLDIGGFRQSGINLSLLRRPRRRSHLQPQRVTFQKHRNGNRHSGAAQFCGAGACQVLQQRWTQHSAKPGPRSTKCCCPVPMSRELNHNSYAGYRISAEIHRLRVEFLIFARAIEQLGLYS